MATLSSQIGYTSPVAMGNSTLPSIIMNMGETFIPGLGLANSIASTYFQIDLTFYIISAFAGIACLIGASYGWDYLWAVASRYVMTTVEIRHSDECYNFLMYWVTKQNFSTNTLRFVASVRTSSDYVWTGEDEGGAMEHEGEDQDEISEKTTHWDKMKTVNYIPSQGRHLFWFRGRPFMFARWKNEQQPLWGGCVSETIYISTLGRNTKWLKDLLQEAQIAYHERDGGKTVIYRGTKPPGGSADELEWLRCLSRPPRPMSTVVLDDKQKSEIIGDMKEYLSPYTRKWYSNRGLPYRRGYLFHGPPGTGKTSLCFALAGLLNLRIYVVSLNSKSVTEDSLAKLFSDLPWRCIILLEDIDSAGITTKRAEAKEEAETKSESKDDKTAKSSEGENSTNPKGITLSAFLNIIDGVASSEGRILVMTTNHIEKLDPAILRPGRVDVTIRFRFADKSMTRSIFKAIYGTKEDSLKSIKDAKIGKEEVRTRDLTTSHSRSASTSSQRTLTDADTPTWSVLRQHNFSEAEVDTMADEFGDKMPEDEFTPAEVQGYLLRHKHEPQVAVDGIDKFVQTLRDEKLVQKNGISQP